MSEGPGDDQRQGQRTSKMGNKWQRHFFNIHTARFLISLGRMAVEIFRAFGN